MLYETPNYGKSELQLPRTISAVYKHDDTLDFPEDRNHIDTELLLQFIADAKVRYRLRFDILESNLIAAGYTLKSFRHNNWMTEVNRLEDRYNYYLVRVK